MVRGTNRKGYKMFLERKETKGTEWPRPTADQRRAAYANGVKPSTFRSRIAAGWDVERAINWPTADNRNAAYDNGINPSTFRSRVTAGWPVEKAISTPARPYI